MMAMLLLLRISLFMFYNWIDSEATTAATKVEWAIFQWKASIKGVNAANVDLRSFG
jgi:hypothetical protein